VIAAPLQQQCGQLADILFENVEARAVDEIGALRNVSRGGDVDLRRDHGRRMNIFFSRNFEGDTANKNLATYSAAAEQKRHDFSWVCSYCSL
jgi:hypothetical protein